MARKSDMQTAFARFERLSNNLTFLRLASPVERIAMPHRLADLDTFNATWADFRPAMPLSAVGAVAGGVIFGPLERRWCSAVFVFMAFPAAYTRTA